MLIKIFICIAMGAGMGWFVSSEWEKHHKKDVCEWKAIEPVKKIVTKDDIRILDWRTKKSMQITIKNGDEIKIFELEDLDELQLKNIEYFLEKQKDALFESLLNCCKANRPRASFERYHEISDALTKIETFRFDKEFSSV